MKNILKYGIIFFTISISSSSFSQTLTLESAKKIAARAQQYSAKKSWKISVAIVNAEGNLIFFERSNGTYVGSISSAQEKAISSNAFQRSTSAFVEAVKSGRQGILSGKNIVAIEGGVPILIKGKHVGAIGISGAKAIEDEEIANDAIKAILE